MASTPSNRGEQSQDRDRLARATSSQLLPSWLLKAIQFENRNSTTFRTERTSEVWRPTAGSRRACALVPPHLTCRVASARSRDKLRASTQSLLDERDHKSITVTDIVRRAGLTRPTFYAAYSDLPAAITDAAWHRLSVTFDEFSLDADGPADDRTGEIAAAFTQIAIRVQDHAEFYLRAMHGPGGLQILTSVNAFIAERLRSHSPLSRALQDDPIPIESSSSALAAGITWLALEWLSDPTAQSPSEFASLIRDLIVHATEGGLAHHKSLHEAQEAHQ